MPNDFNFFSFGAYGSEPIIRHLSENLSNMSINVSFIGVNESKSTIVKKKINISESSFAKNFLLRRINYYLLVFKTRKNQSKGFNCICYFPGCFLLAFLNNPILIIPSFSVSNNPIKRKFVNLLIQIEAFFFSKVIVFSLGMQSKLLKKSSVLTLGVNNYLSSEPKTKKITNFLYIGTLYNRRILDTVVGFHNFLKQGGKGVYHIVGGRHQSESSKIQKYISTHDLSNDIVFHGEQDSPSQLFDLCEVGVSYIPINEYFDIQPATKTHEYLANGMYVIATNTSENRKIININNGALIEDSSDEFAIKCHHYINNIKSGFCRKKLVDENKKLLWKHIVTNDFFNIIK